MQKKAISIILTIAVMIIIILTAYPRQETAGLPVTVRIESLSDMLNLLSSKMELGDEGEDALLELAQRNDAIGYAANILLAEKLDDKEAFIRRALSLYDSSEVRLLLAEWLNAGGKQDAAKTEYLVLLPDKRALDCLRAMDVDTTLILDSLVAGKYWQAVVDELDIMAGTDHTTLAATDNIYLGQAMVMLGRYEEALPLLAELALQFPENEVVLWHYARALEAVGQTDKAMVRFSEVGALGAYRLGRLHEQMGSITKAATAYTKSEEPVAIWRGAVLWDELGNHQEALALYRKLAQESNAYQDDALYRMYHLLRSMEDLEAVNVLAELSVHPAWMSRLGMVPSWSLVDGTEESESTLLEKLEAYRNAGRDDLVIVELDIAWRYASPAEKIFLGEWYLQSADYRQAVRWGSGALRDMPSRAAYVLAYPRPFPEEVKQAAMEFNLEPELIWAVMREESRFQPAVASRVGALGLMQVMPATGREIAAKLTSDFNEEDLLKPAVNIRFGAYYLRTMLDRYDGDVDKALAAYNAGPGNVRRWRESILGASTDGFPTAVAYTETREYITKVKNVYLTYQWLYAN